MGLYFHILGFYWYIYLLVLQKRVDANFRHNTMEYCFQIWGSSSLHSSANCYRCTPDWTAPRCSTTSDTLQVDCHCSAVFTDHLAINKSSFSIVKQSSCSWVLNSWYSCIFCPCVGSCVRCMDVWMVLSGAAEHSVIIMGRMWNKQ